MSSEENAAAPGTRGSFGRFIQTYSSFLSSFVIGVAGLIATSIYQCNQSQVAARQADSQQKIAKTQAENNWKIERAKILSENLQVLTAQGGGNVEQRYGVLLSLTRGDILDPELAVSYALELGKENPDFMRSVLANTNGKDYRRLANAFVLSCEQRFGVTRPVPLCRDDKLADRSAAIAELFSEEIDAELTGNHGGEAAADPQKQGSPLSILREEREVHAGLSRGRILWLFAPFLNDMYERRQWDEIAKFEAYSIGAKLVAALDLLAIHNGEFATKAEVELIHNAHEQHRRWLKDYLLGPSCDTECKARIANYMLTTLSHSQGNFSEPLRALIERPHAEAVGALTRLHARLLQCQVATADAAVLRDQVLVPSLQEQLAQKNIDPTTLDDEVGLLALIPDPTDPAVQKPWQAVIDSLQKLGNGHFQRAFLEKRAAQKRAQKDPPPSMRKTTFCTVPGNDETENADADTE